VLGLFFGGFGFLLSFFLVGLFVFWLCGATNFLSNGRARVGSFRVGFRIPLSWTSSTNQLSGVKTWGEKERWPTGCSARRC